MNIESQVCSLESAKRLKELGVKQPSLFIHLIGGPLYFEECLPLMGDGWYQAYTVAELGNLLPNQINNKFLTSHRCSRDGWWVFYANKNDKDEDINATWDLNEANARAKMLIYLIENKFVKR